MKTVTTKKIVSIAVMLFLTCVLFAATKQDALNTAERGKAFLIANGKDKLIAETNKTNGMFVNGDLYIYTLDMNGICLSHPMLPSFRGKSFMNLKDADGKYFIKEAITLLKNQDSCWLSYKWNNPVTKKVGLKHSYFLKSNGVIISAGVWD